MIKSISKEVLVLLNIKPFMVGIFLLITTAVVDARPLTIGSLSNTPAEEIATFLPFAEYLAAGLEGEGIDGAQVKVKQTYHEIAKLMKNGKVDLFIDSSLSALTVLRLSKGQFLARRWKKGVSKYRSVIFVRKDSPIHSLADLSGKTISFEERFSSSGYLLPSYEIKHKGLMLLEASSQESKQNKQAIRYRFSDTGASTLLWVLHGRNDAGAMAENKFLKLSAPIAGEFRVIYESRVIPYHMVVQRAGLKKTLSEAIHARLLNMENTETGRKVLKDFENTTQFDDAPDEVMRNLLSINLETSTDN